MSGLRCPECGAAMNRHAEKLAYLDGTAELQPVDRAGGGVLEEIHACPGCGNIESRRVPLAGSAGREQDRMTSAS